MGDPSDELKTIQDFVRWGASRFRAAHLWFGHGTDNALDDAWQLVIGALHLDPGLPADYRACRLTGEERRQLTRLIEQRIEQRIPVAYLTGRAWFAGLEFRVTPDVLVPRSPLAELIETGFEPWTEAARVGRVLDLCAGSGCLGIAAAYYLPEAEIDLADISAPALEVARDNVKRHGLDARVRVLRSDLFEALSGQTYDVIVSNPPYVSTAELAVLPPEYAHEPQIGLEAGAEGLDLVLRILAEAAAFLAEEGLLVLEVGATGAVLERHLPDVPFTWVELERGGEGVLVLTREQLDRYRPQLREGRG